MSGDWLYVAMLAAFSAYGYASIYKTLNLASAEDKCVLCIYLGLFGYAAGMTAVWLNSMTPLSSLLFWVYVHNLLITLADMAITQRTRALNNLPTGVRLDLEDQLKTLREIYRGRS